MFSTGNQIKKINLKYHLTTKILRTFEDFAMNNSNDHPWHSGYRFEDFAINNSKDSPWHSSY